MYVLSILILALEEGARPRDVNDWLKVLLLVHARG